MRHFFIIMLKGSAEIEAQWFFPKVSGKSKFRTISIAEIDSSLVLDTKNPIHINRSDIDQLIESSEEKTYRFVNETLTSKGHKGKIFKLILRQMSFQDSLTGATHLISD